MDSLLDELNSVDNQINLFDKDINYLAMCYINEDTNFELPVSDDDTIIEIEYNVLVQKVKEKIIQLNPTIRIDVRTLMSYIDYYYQFINKYT
jgi:hypothetical protein